MAKEIIIGNLTVDKNDKAMIGTLKIPVLKGDPGEAGKIISINVEMLKSSESAYAINNGTQTDAEIVLGIPRGTGISTATINDHRRADH